MAQTALPRPVTGLQPQTSLSASTICKPRPASSLRSDLAPVLRMPDRDEEAGRGLQMVDALSDVWGWSPVTGRGKAVWAILFCA